MRAGSGWVLSSQDCCPSTQGPGVNENEQPHPGAGFSPPRGGRALAGCGVSLFDKRPLHRGGQEVTEGCAPGGPARPISVGCDCEIKLSLELNQPSWRPCPWRGSDPTSGSQSGPSSPQCSLDASEGRTLHPSFVLQTVSPVILSLHSSLS